MANIRALEMIGVLVALVRGGLEGVCDDSCELCCFGWRMG